MSAILLPLVLFVFETEAAEATFLSSNVETLRNTGVLGRSWRAWGAAGPERHRLEQFGQLPSVQHTPAEHIM